VFIVLFTACRVVIGARGLQGKCDVHSAPAVYRTGSTGQNVGQTNGFGRRACTVLAKDAKDGVPDDRLWGSSGSFGYYSTYSQGRPRSK
jgi:hypothetical protein